MNTACYVHNRVTLRKRTLTTLYEVWKGRRPTVKYFHVFGSKCYILADREQRRKMDPKSDEGIFLGYSTNNRAFRVFNSRSKVLMESINVVVDDQETDVTDDVETSLNDAPADLLDKSNESESTQAEPEADKINKGPLSEFRRIILKISL
jgi:hypothetical protein